MKKVIRKLRNNPTILYKKVSLPDDRSSWKEIDWVVIVLLFLNGRKIQIIHLTIPFYRL